MKMSLELRNEIRRRVGKALGLRGKQFILLLPDTPAGMEVIGHGLDPEKVPAIFKILAEQSAKKPLSDDPQGCE